MDTGLIFGTIAAVFAGNALSVWFFYALFFAEAQRKKGVPEDRLPGWVYIGGSVPPFLCAWFAYSALY